MKAILISGYHYNERIEIVEVRETDKSYMVGKIRFKKGFESNGLLSSARSGTGAWSEPMDLYSHDSEYALNKIKAKKELSFCLKVKKHVHSNEISFDQAKKIAEILGL